jgi:Transglycosylase SLT domain
MSKKWTCQVEQENILANILFRSIGYICIVFVFMHLTSCSGTSSDNQDSVTVDPFDYQGECELDESQLDNAEKEAIVHVQKYAEQFSISPALIMAIIRQESNFDPNAIGDAGLSIGYMQLHWAAAYDAGYRSSRDIFSDFSQESKDLAKEDWLIDGLDKDINIQHGTGYINICHNQYKDDPVYGEPLKSTVSCYHLGRTTGPSMRNETTYVNPVVEFYNDYSDICEASEVTFHHHPVGIHYSSALKLLDFSGARVML